MSPNQWKFKWIKPKETKLIMMQQGNILFVPFWKSTWLGQNIMMNQMIKCFDHICTKNTQQ